MDGFSCLGGSIEIELRVCVEGGPEGAAAMLAVAPNDFLDAIVILRVGIGLFGRQWRPHVRLIL